MKFKENQNMLTTWLLLIILAVIAAQVFAISPNYMDVFKTSGFLLSVIVLLFLLLIKLKTTYDSEGIRIVFIPFIWNKFIPWSDIASAYIRTYTFADFGGWGYRLGKWGKAYSAKGDQGLQLIMKDGSQLMIGTQKPEEIQKIINQYKPYKDEF